MTTFCHPYRRGTGWRSQGFRTNPGGFNPAGGHTGFDQAMPVGTPLYAPGDGIVRNSSWLTKNYKDNPWWLTQMGGDTLVIDCTDSFGRSDTMPTFIFAHCSITIAEVGQKVRKGQLVALSGNTGTASTGAHVHVEALPPNWDWNNGVYGRVNAEQYFTEWPEDIPQGAAAIAPQGDVVKPAPTTPKKESEVPTYNRIAPAPVKRRLAKGKTATLVTDATNSKTQNFAELGLGHYDVDLFLNGSGLTAGESVTVQFFIIPTGGKPSGYFKHEIVGTADGTWSGTARFKMPILRASRLEATIVSSKEDAYLESFAADVYAWKA